MLPSTNPTTRKPATNQKSSCTTKNIRQYIEFRLLLVRPCERYFGLSRSNFPQRCVAAHRVAPRLGDVLICHDIQMGAPLCASRRRDARCRILAHDVDGHVFLPALGSLDLRYAARCRTVFEPIPDSSLFSVFTTSFSRADSDDYVAAHRCDRRDVISSAHSWLLFRERGLTRRWSQRRPTRYNFFSRLVSFLLRANRVLGGVAHLVLVRSITFHVLNHSHS